MSEPQGPVIFDRKLLVQRRIRALKANRQGQVRPAGFLRDHAAQDVRERLDATERSFDVAVDMSSDDGGAARILSESARISQGLIRMAQTPCLLAPTGGVAGDEEALPFARSQVGLVTSVLNLQFVNDLPGALVQVRRALKPDGLFIGALIGGATLRELRDVMTREELEASGGAAPRVAPFVDVRDMGSLLQRAGFALPVTDADRLTVRYESLFGLMADLRAMAAGNVLAARSRKPWTRGRAFRAAELYAELYGDPDGRIRATFELVHFSAWAPDPSQQKPMKPGSAKASLAEALGAQERSAGEKARS